MKRLIKNLNGENVLELNIDLNYIRNIEVAATTIKPVIIDKDNKLIDEDAKEGFAAFVENLFEIITAYDFEILSEHDSGSFPYTSKYRWIAHRTEIDADNIPKLIKLRVSEHTQNFGEDRVGEISKQNKEEAQALKQPKSKKKQRYVLEDIAVNELKCETYEEALHICEAKIRNWLVERDIDLGPYGPAIW